MLTDLSVEIKQIKSKEVDPNGDVLCSDILSLSPAEILERQQFLRFQIIRNRLSIDDKRLDALFDTLLVSSTLLVRGYLL
jgi:hypothetical protein